MKRSVTAKSTGKPKAKAKARARTTKARAGEVAVGGEPDAIEILLRQHREVEALLAEFDQASSDDEAHELAGTICDKLTVHATLEEEIFYPAAREDDTNDLVLESAEEHLSVKRIIADVQGLESEDERLRPKMNVLKEQVGRHVHEEESELFPRVKAEMDSAQRRELGRHMRERAAELEVPPSNGTSNGHQSWATLSADAPGDRRSTRRSH